MLSPKFTILSTTQMIVKPMDRWINKCWVTFVFILICGCATANNGSLSRSQDVTRAFETFQVFAGYRYYYLNLENNPYAVVALQSNYSISDPLWVELDPQSETFKKVIGLVGEFPVYSNFRTYGSYILDHQMNRVGYWYSSLRSVSISVDNAYRKVSINTEKPWIEDDDERFIWGGGRGLGGAAAALGL